MQRQRHLVQRYALAAGSLTLCALRLSFLRQGRGTQVPMRFDNHTALRSDGGLCVGKRLRGSHTVPGGAGSIRGEGQGHVGERAAGSRRSLAGDGGLDRRQLSATVIGFGEPLDEPPPLLVELPAPQPDQHGKVVVHPHSTSGQGAGGGPPIAARSAAYESARSQRSSLPWERKASSAGRRRIASSTSGSVPAR